MDVLKTAVEERDVGSALEASLEACLAPLARHPALLAAREAALADGGGQRGALTLSGLIPAAKAFAVASLARELISQAGQRVLVVTADNESADRLARATATFLGWMGG